MKKALLIFFALASPVFGGDVDAVCRYHNGSSWTGISTVYVKVNSKDVRFVLFRQYRETDRIVEVKEGATLSDFSGNCWSPRYITKDFKIVTVHPIDERR